MRRELEAWRQSRTERGARQRRPAPAVGNENAPSGPQAHKPEPLKLPPRLARTPAERTPLVERTRNAQPLVLGPAGGKLEKAECSRSPAATQYTPTSQVTGSPRSTAPALSPRQELPDVEVAALQTCLDLFEEQAPLPGSPPPSPATPLAALLGGRGSWAAAGVPAPGALAAALARLAPEPLEAPEAPAAPTSPPAPASPARVGSPGQLQSLVNGCPGGGDVQSPSVLSPLSLESSPPPSASLE